ncbi:MAG: O-phospho-L-seryl-tRNA:Cys-tRNA synthase [Candidatus Jordarchaeaceae archaeon]
MFDERVLEKYKNLTRGIEERMINLHPIQSGGRAGDYPGVVQAVLRFVDGYSVCDFCMKGRLDLIDSPPLCDFHKDIAAFLDMDEARLFPGCRQAQYAAFHALVKPGDTIIIDSLAHYSTYLSAERVGANIVEVPHSGYPDFDLLLDAYSEKIEEVKKETGKWPALAFLTHVDYNYGNVFDAKSVGNILHDYGVPFVLNGAYTVGRMPISGRALGADILTASLHKSFASPAPSGLLLANEEYAEVIFRCSSIKGSWSGRKFENKEVETLGCTLPGCVAIGVMAAFPYVVERVKHWDEEVRKARYFIEQLERIRGIKQLGQRPHNHDLIHFESTPFFEVSKNHPRKGFFLYEELRERGVTGVQPGLSAAFKVSTYGKTWDQVKLAAEAFLDIARKYNIPTY